MESRTFVMGILVSETEKTDDTLFVSYGIFDNYAAWSNGVAEVYVPYYVGNSRVGGLAVAAGE